MFNFVLTLYFAVNDILCFHFRGLCHPRKYFDYEDTLYRRIRIIRPWATHLRNPPKKGIGLYYVVYIFNM